MRSGGSGAVKRSGLKIRRPSAFVGSNPTRRIITTILGIILVLTLVSILLLDELSYQEPLMKVEAKENRREETFYYTINNSTLTKFFDETDKPRAAGK